MNEHNSETQQPQAADATTPAEKAVVFVNSEVLAPPKASPMTGVAKVMIEQSTGMMVQDLQSFLKGFEQVGLIALSRLANNLLTYGSPVGPAPGAKGIETHNAEFIQAEGTGQSNEMMKDLFKMVSDYAEVKAKISNTIYNANTPLIPKETSTSPPFTDVSSEAEDPGKKNR
ncbi:hypothetical protein C1631_006920 [Chryseobacterium phosphatilyticum]|uniref:Uncharacterized protein n=1 Tax=Chryseobacterium phosphatilyticum TaxID=475075 RepID=A0A316XFI5_9FLAO|nr:hypothetical protein [Chryseobacterium phosphatilyticum]PWN72324.1 hypothetical protein C1631_006920 [Chryseobacterium phosphatilyticum]